ncbi:MAG: hypothetical protein QMD46_12860 [Methanomicrobiales archaeon]|nr:hypothetical protein [Methanomicrobiales archaeon]
MDRNLRGVRWSISRAKGAVFTLMRAYNPCPVQEARRENRKIRTRREPAISAADRG